MKYSIYLDKLKSYFTFSGYLLRYSSVKKKPSPLSLILLAPYIFLGNFDRINDIKRFYNSARLPSSLLTNTKTPPTIEVLLVATKKDFDTIPQVIEFAQSNSLNPIGKISIVCPEKDVEYLAQHLSAFNMNIHVVSEKSIIDEADENLIREFSNSRYGWILQQFLTVEFCRKSTYEGVLAINADTILTRSQLWLNSERQQILMGSAEYNLPYYQVVKKIFPGLKLSKYSHITHHMIFQPRLLNEMFNHLRLNKIRDYILLILSNADSMHQSPLCAEYEPYANYIINFHPNMVYLKKFSNISVSRKSAGSLSEICKHYQNLNMYNSISLHSWIDD